MTVFRQVVFIALAAAGCAKPAFERVEWTTMGTVAAVQTRGASLEETAAAVQAAKAEFALVEGLLSAHDPGSELSRLAALPDADVLARCDARMRPCYEAAFAWREKTAGAFDPRWRGTNTLDLGAIAKGFAVDRAAARLPPGGYDVLIDLGGNLKAVRGDWRVGIAGSGETFELREGSACATSAEYYRGKHIYDGRTGRPVTNEVLSVTVIGPEALSADAMSTVSFVFGPAEGGALPKGPRGFSARWILKDGREVSSGADWQSKEHQRRRQER